MATVGFAVESITRKHAKAADALHEEFLVGKKAREHRERIWRRSEQQYVGNMWDVREDPTSDLININMSFSTINTIMPHLTGMEPEFIIAPFSSDATPKNARIQEAYLNRMWRHKPVGAQLGLKASIWDYLVYGDGYIKVTWQITKRAISIDTTTDKVEIYVDRVSPWDVWIDPVSTGIDKAKWVVVRYWTTEEEARADQTLNIPASYSFTTLDPSKDTDSSDRGRKPYDGMSGTTMKWVELYEMYDLVDKTMYVVPKDGDKRPWKVIENISIPIEQVPGYRIAQSPYHMGELEQIYDIQREIDKTRSQQITHRKRNVSKIFIREDALNDEARSAMTSGVVGEMVPIKGEIPLNELVMPLQLQPLPSESYASVSQAQEDMFQITGISEYQRGSAPDITRTATEAQIMQGSSNVKIDAKLNDVELALRNVGEYMLGIAKEVYPKTDVDEMAMFIGGADGRAINQLQAGEDTRSALEAGDEQGAQDIANSAGLFGEAIITPTDEIFVGEYEVMVEHSSTDAVNPRVKAQKYSDIVSKMMEMQPVLQQQGIQIDVGRLVRMWLEAEGIPGVDAIMGGGAGQPQAPPGMMPGQEQGAGQPGMPPGMPPELAALMGGQGAPGGGAPQGMSLPQGPLGAPIGPENTGSLDPAQYPLVG